jgi:hypothetical protein
VSRTYGTGTRFCNSRTHLEPEDESRLDTAKADHQEGRYRGASYSTPLLYRFVTLSTAGQASARRDGDRADFAVIHRLCPSDQAKARQDLRLDDQGYVLVAQDVVDPKRQSGESPEDHHGRVKTFGRLSAIVEKDLRQELRTLVVSCSPS